MKFKTCVLIAGALGMILSSVPAHASLTIVSLLGGGPKPNANYVDFNTVPLGPGVNTVSNRSNSLNPSGSITLTLNPDSQVVLGGLANKYAAPYLSGSNGADFGLGAFVGPDGTRYITTGSDGSVSGASTILEFGSPQQYLGLLWGSVDNYNTLKFYSGGVGGTLVGTILGSQVIASPNGDQGVNGTRYVNIDSTVNFDTVVATSSQYAFEFDNVAYSATPSFGSLPTPEPSSVIAWALLGLALGGGNWWRRRRSS